MPVSPLHLIPMTSKTNPTVPLDDLGARLWKITEGSATGAIRNPHVDAAIKAITCNAAYVLGLEDEIGSLRWGKRADFTILEDDPYDVGIEGLRDIPIWGTVFEGEKFPI